MSKLLGGETNCAIGQRSSNSAVRIESELSLKRYASHDLHTKSLADIHHEVCQESTVFCSETTMVSWFWCHEYVV